MGACQSACSESADGERAADSRPESLPPHVGSSSSTRSTPPLPPPRDCTPPLAMPGGRGGGNGSGGNGDGGHGDDEALRFENKVIRSATAFAEKYELHEVVGMGSTCVCHRAVERTTGAEFACKVIDKKRVAIEHVGLLDQFQHEIDVLLALQRYVKKYI